MSRDKIRFRKGISPESNGKDIRMRVGLDEALGGELSNFLSHGICVLIQIRGLSIFPGVFLFHSLPTLIAISKYKIK